MLHVIGFGGSPLVLEAKTEAIWPAMQEGVQLNLALEGQVPDPFRSGVVYRREGRRADGSREDHFRLWRDVARAGSGDCEDLSAWDVARKRQQGDASARVGLIEFPYGGWHAVSVSRRAPLRRDPCVYPADLPRYRGAALYAGPEVGWNPAGWWVTDTSYALGMRDQAASREGYHPAVRAWEREPEIGGFGDYLRSPWALGAALMAAAMLVGTRTRQEAIAGSTDLSRLPWSNRLSRAFLARWVEICAELEADPRHGLAVMRAESNFDKGAINCSTAAIGLIQFMPRTLLSLKSNFCRAQKMTDVEQLELVRLYFLPAKGRLRTLTDWYTWTFRPKDMGQSENHVHYQRGQEGYTLNAGLDINGDGLIQRWEPAQKAALLLAAEEQRLSTGISGLPTLQEHLTELASITTPQALSAFVSRLKLIAPGAMLEVLTRWEKNVLTLPLEDSRGVVRNLTYHAHQAERSHEATLKQTAVNALNAMTEASGQLAQSAANVVTDTSETFNQGQNQTSINLFWPTVAVGVGVGLYLLRK